MARNADTYTDYLMEQLDRTIEYTEYVASNISGMSPSYYDETRENEKYLLDIMKKQMSISEEDMKSSSVVKSKFREFNINKILPEE